MCVGPLKDYTSNINSGIVQPWFQEFNSIQPFHFVETYKFPRCCVSEALNVTSKLQNHMVENLAGTKHVLHVTLRLKI
jgi:hypothetical protein